MLENFRYVGFLEMVSIFFTMGPRYAKFVDLYLIIRTVANIGQASSFVKCFSSY